jgi:phosphate-selective porin OprO/OprP
MQKRIIAAAIAAALSGNTFANDSDELEKLRSLVQELDQRIRVLDRKSELAAEAADARKKETPIVKASENGFGLQSADGQNEIKLRGLLQYDYRSFGGGANDVRNRSDARAGSLDPVTGFHNANDTWLGRRIRPTLEGTVLGKYDFRFTPEFAGGSASVTETRNSLADFLRHHSRLLTTRWRA